MSPRTALRSLASDASPLSGGAWLIALIGLIAGAVLFFWPVADPRPMTMWTFAPPHVSIYEPLLDEWNLVAEAAQSDALPAGVGSESVWQATVPAEIQQVHLQSLQRRLVAGFLGDVPIADLVEVERSIVGVAFQGPIDRVGFLDLTDRLEAERLMDVFNPPSLTPWTLEGRVFGLPHDVHPVLLGYRADIVEDRLGIDVATIETWDDFERTMHAAMRDRRSDSDGDGRPDWYPISFWPGPGHTDKIEAFILQAGGGFFDENGTPIIDSEVNSQVLGRLASWCLEPTRIAADIPEFNPGGNQLKAQGYALFYLMPDWMCHLWRRELPQLQGTMKLMPLPAWDPDGRRTTVWGGSMLGISRASDRHDQAWELAKHLYLSSEAAVEMYRTGDIITPVMQHWDNPVYDLPDFYFSGQPKGRMYIDQAPNVPERNNSPFNRLAAREVEKAMVRVFDQARAENISHRGTLVRISRQHLSMAQERVRDLIRRNVFHPEGRTLGDPDEDRASTDVKPEDGDS